MSDRTILYFHGYGSSPCSDKVTDLSKSFGDVQAPQIPVLFDEAFSMLGEFVEKFLKEKKTPIIVGTSLGGYWAGVIGDKYNIPSVLVNPSVNPAASLGRYKNPDLTDDELQKYAPLGPSTSPRIVILADDDAVIAPHAAIALFDGNAKVQRYPDGGHRFQCPERIADAVRYLMQYETTDIAND